LTKPAILTASTAGSGTFINNAGTVSGANGGFMLFFNSSGRKG